MNVSQLRFRNHLRIVTLLTFMSLLLSFLAVPVTQVYAASTPAGQPAPEAAPAPILSTPAPTTPTTSPTPEELKRQEEYLRQMSEQQTSGVNNFIINKFRADYILDNNVPGGSMSTTENIDLTFSAQNHGILRAIPESYNGYRTKLRIVQVQRDGKDEPYDTYTQNGNLVLKIGSKSKTITGAHSYKIVYEQQRIVLFDQSAEHKQQFYWDVNGDQWGQLMQRVEATVQLKGQALKPQKANCYTGVTGAVTQHCIVTQQEGAVLFAADRVGPKQTLTIRMDLPEIFTPPGIKERLTDHAADITAVAIGIFTAAVYFVAWWRKGRDYKGGEVIVPQYEPPKGLTPAEVGLLADYNVDSRDITATLIDLAVRGYVKIHEDTKKFAFFKNRNYSLELVNNDMKGLKYHETILLNAIFKQYSVGETVEMSKFNKSDMITAITSSKSKLKQSLIKEYGLFEETKGKYPSWIFTAAVSLSLGILFFAYHTFWALFGGAIVIVAIIVFGMLVDRRSRAGVVMYEYIQGLKLYMNTAEKERLKMMQSVDRPYAEPAKTVALYEKLLPFAIALGVEKSWSQQFDGILTEAPDWYTGTNFAAFSAGNFASSIGSMSQSFSSSTSSSSGSGGGSAGGGGGGGGGGGW